MVKTFYCYTSDNRQYSEVVWNHGKCQCIGEIWHVAGFAYAISLGTMDLNIIKDSWSKIKVDKTGTQNYNTTKLRNRGYQR